MNIEEAKKYINDNVDFFIDGLAGCTYREVLASNQKEFQIIRGGVFLRNLHTNYSTVEIDNIIEKVREWAAEDVMMNDAVIFLRENNALDDYTRTLASVFLDWRKIDWKDVSYELVSLNKPKLGILSFLSSKNPSVTAKISKLPQVIAQFLAAFERYAQADNVSFKYTQMTAKFNSSGYGTVPVEDAELYTPFTFDVINVSNSEIDNQVNRFINNQHSHLDSIVDNLVITVKLQA